MCRHFQSEWEVKSLTLSSAWAPQKADGEMLSCQALGGLDLQWGWGVMGQRGCITEGSALFRLKQIKTVGEGECFHTCHRDDLSPWACRPHSATDPRQLMPMRNRGVDTELLIGCNRTEHQGGPSWCLLIQSELQITGEEPSPHKMTFLWHIRACTALCFSNAAYVIQGFKFQLLPVLICSDKNNLWIFFCVVIKKNWQRWPPIWPQVIRTGLIAVGLWCLASINQTFPHLNTTHIQPALCWMHHTFFCHYTLHYHLPKQS